MSDDLLTSDQRLIVELRAQLATVTAQRDAVKHGLETTAANLAFQVERCNNLTGAIQEVVRSNLIKLGLLETVLKALLLQVNGHRTFDLGAELIKEAAKAKIVRENIEGGGVRIGLVL